MSNTYRLHIPALHTASTGSLTATTVLASVPCDRNATLESVIISSRGGITHNAVNYSQLAIKNGSTTLAVRLFNAESLAALTPESLSITGDASVTSSTCLKVEYDYSALGLAVDCDFTLVFRLARG